MDNNDKSNHIWSLFGNFRKITFQVKERIVQGLKVVFEDGSVKSIGMESTNQENKNQIVEFEVPENQHIKDVYVLKVGGKSASFGFMTNENVRMFPFDMPTEKPGPSSRKNFELCHVPVVSDFALYARKNFKHIVSELTKPNYYLCGIQGRIGQRPGGPPSEPPCLIDLMFCYALTFNSIDTSKLTEIFCTPLNLILDDKYEQVDSISCCNGCGKIFVDVEAFRLHHTNCGLENTDSEDSD